MGDLEPIDSAAEHAESPNKGAAKAWAGVGAWPVQDAIVDPERAVEASK